MSKTLVHPTAIIGSGCKIGNGVSVGPYTIIHDDVEIGDNAKIDSHCELGYPSALANGNPLIIGRNALIRSHSIFYQGSNFGDDLVTGHRVTVREGVKAGKNLQIGTLSDFQGDCVIGDYVRTHSNVHIGKLSSIGDFAWIFPYVVLTNDPHPPSEFHIGVTVGAYAIIATMSVVLPGVKVGEHSLVAAHSMVSKNVPSHMVVGGAPAKVLAETKNIMLKDGTGRPAYPWPGHFHRGYPDQVVQQWVSQFGNGEQTD